MNNYTKDIYHSTNMNYIKKNIKREYNHLIILLVLSLVLFSNFLFENDYISLFCTILACTYILVCDSNYVLPIMIYISMYAYLFIFNVYNLYVFICLSFLIRIWMSKKKYTLYAFIIIPFYLITHLISTQLNLISLGDIIPFIGVICLFFTCCSYRVNQRESCIKYFIIGHITSSLLGLFKGLTRLPQILNNDYLSAYSWADTLRFSGLSYDANFYALITIVVLCILLFGFRYHFRNNLLWLIVIILDIIFGMLTYSKSFYLCLVVILAITLIKTEESIKRKIIKAIPIIILFCFIFRNQIGQALVLLLKRFAEADGINGLTSSRYDLWIQYLKMIGGSFESIIIGNGIQDIGLKAAHNTYLEIIYKFGIMGLLIDIGYLVICVKQVGIAKHKNSINEIMIIFLLLLLLFNLSAYTFYALWTCLFITIILVKAPDTE